MENFGDLFELLGSEVFVDSVDIDHADGFDFVARGLEVFLEYGGTRVVDFGRDFDAIGHVLRSLIFAAGVEWSLAWFHYNRVCCWFGWFVDDDAGGVEF